MDHISEIYERARLGNIREFLLYGVECLAPSDAPHGEQLSL